MAVNGIEVNSVQNREKENEAHMFNVINPYSLSEVRSLWNSLTITPTCLIVDSKTTIGTEIAYVYSKKLYYIIFFLIIDSSAAYLGYHYVRSLKSVNYNQIFYCPSMRSFVLSKRLYDLKDNICSSLKSGCISTLFWNLTPVLR